MKTRIMRIALVAAAVAGCAGNTGAMGRPAPVDEVVPLLMETANAWNRADIAGHVSSYADSAEFMAPGPVVGRERIRESLLRSFWREGRPVQQLRYEQVQVRPLGSTHALMTGHFVLYGGGRPDRSGWFTLVWERTAQGWKIIHDHSS